MDGPDTIRDVPDCVPARILNEFSYCPRLAYLEWVSGEFVDNYYTEEGRFTHRVDDRETGTTPAPTGGDGRPALALDLMEEFRPIVADSVVLGAANNGVITTDDFIRRGNAVAMKDPARKKFIEAYERRMDSLITHPLFEYRLSYRRVLEVQTRLLARAVTGELADYTAFTTR